MAGDGLDGTVVAKWFSRYAGCMSKNYAGWIGVVLALLALAQRLGNYEDKPLAIVLVVGAALSFTILAIIWIRDKARRNPVPQGAASQKAIVQETHSNSSAAAVGSIGSIGPGASVQITQVQGSPPVEKGLPEISLEILDGFFNWGPFEGKGPGYVRSTDLFITLHLRLVNTLGRQKPEYWFAFYR